ncbi:lysylphosphatidylglycerol synthase transmembrane domain-containing protein [Anoxybacillus sp. TBDG-1]
MKTKQIKILMRLISLICIVAFIWMTIHHFDAQLLFDLMHSLVSQPWHASYMFIMYGLAFALRAIAWKWYLPHARFQTCIDGLFASLFINHLFPIKIGDVARIGICAKQNRIPFAIVAQSVIVLRLFDFIVLFLFAFLGTIVYMHTAARSVFIFPFVFCGIVALFFVLRSMNPSWLQKHKQHWDTIWKSRRFVPIVIVVVFSWVCEAIVLFEMAKMVAFPLSFVEALWVNSMTVVGQVFQITPGGLATYEAVMAFTLTRIHSDWEQAYALALATHLFKFLFSYVVGLYVWWRIPTLWTFVRKEKMA